MSPAFRETLSRIASRVVGSPMAKPVARVALAGAGLVLLAIIGRSAVAGAGGAAAATVAPAAANASAGLEVRGIPRSEARRRAGALFATFGLDGFERAYPFALSGGMRQRVAFARTVLAARDLLLLDEPFGALDALTRAGLQRWLVDIWGELGATCLLVTHDVEEALLLADRIYVLTARPGRVRLERPVPLERPRRLDMLARPELVALKAELLAALVDEAMPAPGGGDV